MEDQILPAPNYNNEKMNQSPKDLRKFILTFLFILVVLTISVFSYFLGKNSVKVNPQDSDEEIAGLSTYNEYFANNEAGVSPEASITAIPTGKSPRALSPSPTQSPKSITISPVKDLNGFRSSNNGGSSTLEIRAGRNKDLVTRGFISFDITNLPAGASISEATLRMYQGRIIGNPYASGGKLMLDHLTFGDSLDPTDYALPALTSSFAVLSQNSRLEWKEADTTDRVKNDVANARSMSQFRIHFQNENTGGDTAGDFAYFESTKNTLGSGYTPQLIVKYY